MRKYIRYVLLILFLFVNTFAVILVVSRLRKELSSRDTSASTQYTNVTPTEDTTTILQNPLMGFQEHTVEEPEWWPWSTGYLRASAACEEDGKITSCDPLNWDLVNPEQGVYDFSSIDTYLQNMKDREKYMVFRVRNVVSSNDLPDVPQWASDLGVTTSSGQEPWDGRTGVEIDYHKCTFLDLWDDLVNELIAKYDNDPAVVAVDIGSYGWYGEWFSGKTVTERGVEWGEEPNDANDPTLQQSLDTRTRIVRMFTGGSGSGKCVDNNGQEQTVSYSYDGFQNTPVMISKGDREDLGIGVKEGAGVRFDGIGVASLMDGNFREYTDPFINGGTLDGVTYDSIWQTTPILGEFGIASVNSDYVQRSLCYAREFHMVGIHNNFNSKPTGVGLDDFFRELGYRISLSEARYTSTLDRSENFTIDFDWINQGTSPAYGDYPLYLYVKPVGGSEVLEKVKLTNTDIRSILPAEVTQTSTDFLTCPKGTPPVYASSESISFSSLEVGNYDLYFGFEENVYDNQIELAITTQQDTEGRYYLGQLELQDGDVSANTYCGDGSIQTPNDDGINEECDDGNTSNGDGCSFTCVVESVATYCGDGTIQIPNDNGVDEQCDDGNTLSGDGCDSTCQIEDSPELTYCGDGSVQMPNDSGDYEQCDDGNTINSDGCSSLCQVEQDSDQTYCGDSIVQNPNSNGVAERCDDGNNTNGDGCNAICQVEEDESDISPSPIIGRKNIYVPQSGNEDDSNTDDVVEPNDINQDDEVDLVDSSSDKSNGVVDNLKGLIGLDSLSKTGDDIEDTEFIIKRDRTWGYLALGVIGILTAILTIALFYLIWRIRNQKKAQIAEMIT